MVICLNRPACCSVGDIVKERSASSERERSTAGGEENIRSRSGDDSLEEGEIDSSKSESAISIDFTVSFFGRPRGFFVVVAFGGAAFDVEASTTEFFLGRPRLFGGFSGCGAVVVCFLLEADKLDEVDIELAWTTETPGFLLTQHWSRRAIMAWRFFTGLNP